MCMMLLRADVTGLDLFRILDHTGAFIPLLGITVRFDDQVRFRDRRIRQGCDT